MDWKNEIKAAPLPILIDRLKTVNNTSSLVVGCANGIFFEGRILDTDTQAATLAFEVSQTGSVVFVPYAGILSIEVKNPQASLRTLTEGRIARDPSLPVPSFLEIKKLAASSLETMRPTIRFDWPSVVGDEGRAQLPAFITALRDALAKINSDELGSRELSKVQQISVTSKPGSSLEAKISEGVITITFDFDAVLPVPLSEVLVRQLESII